ncbi:MAG: hypothetical protein K5930_07895 [Treponemataceae bacterium]|nr:hypothetical protein [Treponemataceae bacterium]
MALHPIDLQTLYTQLENVSKNVAFQQQGLQLRNSVQQENYSRQLIEKEKMVKEAAQDESETVRIKNQQKKNQNNDNSSEHKEKDTTDESTSPLEQKTESIKDHRLGRIVDVQG